MSPVQWTRKAEHEVAEQTIGELRRYVQLLDSLPEENRRMDKRHGIGIAIREIEAICDAYDNDMIPNPCDSAKASAIRFYGFARETELPHWYNIAYDLRGISMGYHCPARWGDYYSAAGNRGIQFT